MPNLYNPNVSLAMMITAFLFAWTLSLAGAWGVLLIVFFIFLYVIAIVAGNDELDLIVDAIFWMYVLGIILGGFVTLATGGVFDPIPHLHELLWDIFIK